MSETKTGNNQGEIQISHQIAPTEYPPSYHDATRPPGMNYPMPGPPGSQYPHLPPPGSDIPMQPLPSSGPYSQPAYNPNVPNYGPSQPPYPSQYPMQAPPGNAPYNNIGFTNPGPPPPMMAGPGMPNPSSEYNYPKTYVVVPPDNQNQNRRESGDAMDCCKCLLCCCGCIELCRCLGMCLKCICDSDD